MVAFAKGGLAVPARCSSFRQVLSINSRNPQGRRNRSAISAVRTAEGAPHVLRALFGMTFIVEPDGSEGSAFSELAAGSDVPRTIASSPTFVSDIALANNLGLDFTGFNSSGLDAGIQHVGLLGKITQVSKIVAGGDLTMLPVPHLLGAAKTIAPTEGAAFEGTVAEFSDPAGPTSSSAYTATINWGDDTSAALGSISGPDENGVFTVTGSHTYAEEGVKQISITLHTANVANVTVQGTADVADAKLTAHAATVTPKQGVAFSGTVATFTDADPKGELADYTATIVWGDGTTTTATISAAAGGGFDVTGSHTYAVSGTKIVVVVISDVGGSKAAADSTAKISASATSAARLLAAKDDVFSQLGAIKGK